MWFKICTKYSNYDTAEHNYTTEQKAVFVSSFNEILHIIIHKSNNKKCTYIAYSFHILCFIYIIFSF